MMVSEIMATEVMTASTDDTLGEIREIFKSNHIHHLPVVQDNKLVGIVSDRDILKDLSSDVDMVGADNHALDTLKKTADQIMTHRVITVSLEDTIEEASTTMLEKNISCLPILERSGVVVGVVTKSDILKNLFGTRSAART